MKIGDRIREFGLKRFGSVSGLAEKLGVSLQYLSPYLNSKNEPGTPMLLKLANLGCDINWLLQGDKNNNLLKEPTEKYDYGVDMIKQKDEEIRKLLLKLENIKKLLDDI